MLTSPNTQNGFNSEINGDQPASLLEFANHDLGRDIYNITAPFQFDGLKLIAGREETRSHPLKSRIGFYAEDGGIWHKVSHYEYLDVELEDPFITKIDDSLILGAVRVDWRTKPLDFKTVFYEMESLDTMRLLAEGPPQMKDIRLKQLNNGEVLVMTRPQHYGPNGLDRQIGYFKIHHLDELTPERIEHEAVLLSDLYADGEWGGANEIHIIDEETVGVLAHKGKQDDFGNLDYKATVFELNHVTGEAQPMRELLSRNDLPPGPTKTEYHRNVVFSGGLERHGNGQATWYGGVSDATAGHKTIDDPFPQQIDAFFPTAA